ncbi:glycosyltransferase family protein [Arsenicicoccus sp. UBA7492]|uniref:glycosyltransferase family protein n=1 Tax=Arsenicicoccus sp. UBA7492 TaxID=1946057 RepID=UPI002579C5F1|nr:glycosyltransferase [Arsenicicoccus sp. UBA7492]
MKIIILTSAHPTDDVRVMTKVARGLADLGHQVVWCGPDHYFFDDSHDPRISWILTKRGQGWKGRLLALARSARAAYRIDDADWIYSPDPDAAIVALAIARITRTHTLFDIHEDFHNGLLRRRIKRPRLAAIMGVAVRAVITWTARTSDVTVGVSRTIVNMYCPPGGGSFAVLNTAPRSFAERQHQPNPTAAQARVMHGKAVSTNGTHVVLEALRQLPDDQGPRVVFITRPSPTDQPFDYELEQSLRSPYLASHVKLMAGLPHDRMPEVLGSCSAGLISYGRVLGEASLPNRLFEYMASGIAVIAPSYSPEIVQIIESYRCGLTADFENPHDVAAKLMQIATHPDETAAMGSRGRQAFIDHYSWESQLDALEQHLLAFSERRGS